MLLPYGGAVKVNIIWLCCVTEVGSVSMLIQLAIEKLGFVMLVLIVGIDAEAVAMFSWNATGIWWFGCLLAGVKAPIALEARVRNWFITPWLSVGFKTVEDVVADVGDGMGNLVSIFVCCGPTNGVVKLKDIVCVTVDGTLSGIDPPLGCWLVLMIHWDDVMTTGRHR